MAAFGRELGARAEGGQQESKMLAWLSRKKYQFEAVTSLTMLEPSEKRVLCILKSLGLVS